MEEVCLKPNKAIFDKQLTSGGTVWADAFSSNMKHRYLILNSAIQHSNEHSNKSN